MGKIIELESFLKEKKPVKLLNSSLPNEEESVYLTIPLTKFSSKMIRASFKKRVLEEMIKEGYSTECPIGGCDNYKDKNSWICPSCCSDDENYLVRRAVRGYVLKIMKRSKEKGKEKKILSLTLKELVDQAIEKIKKEKIWGEELCQGLLEENKDAPQELVFSAVEKAERKMKEKGFVPEKLWNELLDIAKKHSNNPDEEKKKILKRLLSCKGNSKTAKDLDGVNIEKTISRLLLVLKKRTQAK